MKYVGALVGTMSGSMGGATASRNRGGQYLRQRVVPTNPNTARQMAQRMYLSGAVTQWNMLTDAQRTGWATYAANTPTTDTLGNTIVLTGQQMYIRTYTAWMRTSSYAMPGDAPTNYNRGANVVALVGDTGSVPNVLDMVSGDLANTATMNEVDASGSQLLIFIGRPVGPTINYYNGPYQFAAMVQHIGLGATVTIDTTVADLTIDEPLVEGQRRPVRITNYSADGRYSTAYKAICAVVDNTP